MSKTITLRISEEHYEAFKKYARLDNRKLSNAIETLALKELERVQFVDEIEREGILGDRDLVARIGRGLKEAGAKKGRFVE